MNTNRPPIGFWIGNPIQNPNPLQAPIPAPIQAPIQAPLPTQLTNQPAVTHATVLTGTTRNTGTIHLTAVATAAAAASLPTNVTPDQQLRSNIGIVQEPIKTTLTVHQTPTPGHQVHHVTSTSQQQHLTSSSIPPPSPHSVTASSAATAAAAAVAVGAGGNSVVAGGVTTASAAATSHQTAQQQQQQQFQRLKVEDALSYLDQVKFKFNNQPQVYNDFLDIMKEFKSQSIDTPGVIQRVSNLFRGHPELIVGFNTFLPPGYKIEMQSNDQVNVSMPSSTSILIIHNSTANTVTTNPQMLHLPNSTSSQGPLHATPHHPAVQITTTNSGLPVLIGKTVYSSSPSSQPFLHNQTVNTSARSAPSVESHHTPITLGLTTPQLTTSASINSTLASNNTPSVPTPVNLPPSSGTVGALGTGPGPGPGLPSSTGSGGAGAGAGNSNLVSTCAPGPGGDSNATSAQPVEFNHAINYVNKIKNRFQGQPEVYKQFLEILHAYQKEQKCLKEGIKPDAKPLNESQVYAQVAKLFQNQEDLLQEFGQFLPDANAAAVNVGNSVFPAVQGGINSGIHHGTPLHGPSTGSTISTAISAAHHVDNLAAAHRAATNDHGAIVKKPLARPGGTVIGSGINSNSGIQIKRQASCIQSSLNKPKMTSLRDVTLAEAGKYGSLNEYAFFDKVRKALRIQDVYENFLRCLFLYNHEIVSRNELVLLVTPFLGKFPELLKYFKDFLGYKDGNSSSNNYSNFNMSSTNNNMFMEGLPQRVAGIRERERERITEGSGMEIDYASCKRYGASYRALPKNYVQPECSGRTPLCREVLNDTWVSFPSWSEDSTFVTSKKTQYEEFIYRCEDERFELDVVIETNLSTIRVLEAVQKRLSRMTPDERNKFRLDDCLGGTSAIIHQRSIRRIYGDKAPEIIDGLKKNPSIAVPLVLRRLKNKEDEWKEAQKQFNKIWREQSEKYYLKSLDHQGISFKQNDIKYLRSKSLLNEIETFYEERHEQNEENMAAAGEGTGNNTNNGQHCASGPHMTLKYRNKAMIEEACNLIIHHVKRQTSIHKEDKQKIKQLLKHFIPDLFATPRGELSDDEIEDFEIETNKKIDDANGKSKDNTSTVCFPVNLTNAKDPKANKCDSVNLNSTAPNSSPGANDNGVANCVNGNGSQAKNVNPMLNNDPDDNYALFFVNNYWYLFFRLHHILCDRLAQMHERATILIAEEEKEKTLRKESTAAALRLKPKNDYEVEEYFPALIDMVKQVLDGNLDFNQFEDQLREMFGIHAYVAFTLDKVVQNIVRQLQHIACDETCIQCTEMFIEESKHSGTGGPCSSHHIRATAEVSYQKKAEQLLSDENCFKIIIYKGEGKVTIELIVTDSVESEDGGEVEKWSEYVEKYVKEVENEISDELKERLSRKPVFLPRNIRMWRYKAKEKMEKANEQKDNNSLQVVDDTQCKFNVNSYKMVFVVQSESYLCKRNALAKARKAHKSVSRRLHSKFNQFHQNWLEKEVTNEQRVECEDWLMGHIYEDEEDQDVVMKDEEIKETCKEETSNSETKVNRENEEPTITSETPKMKTQRLLIDNPNKSPYRPFCKYSSRCK